MWDKIRAIGIFFTTLKGWAYALSIGPTIGALISGVFEDRPWSEIILISMITLAVGLLAVYYVLLIWDRTTNYFITRKQQKRIARDLKVLLDDNFKTIDTSTAAAIWSGTLDEKSVTQRLCFRRIKGAINRKEIKNPRRLNKNGKAYIKTAFPLDELTRFFVERGIILERDI